MNIEYVSDNEELADIEISILNELGHVSQKGEGNGDDGGKLDINLLICSPGKLAELAPKYSGSIVVRTSRPEDLAYEEFLADFNNKRSIEIVRFCEKEQGKLSGPVIRWSIQESNGWTGETNCIVTNANYRDIDFDLYNRTINGLQAFIGKLSDELVKSAKINLVFSRPYYSLSFAQSLVWGCPTVCYGPRWGTGESIYDYIQNGVNGFVTDNLDEMRWILRRLSKKSLDELKGLSYNAMETGKKLFGRERNKKLWKQVLQLI